MDEINKAIKFAMQEFHKEYGENAKLEDGKEFVTIFNNCVLILSLNGNELGVHFIGGKPLRADLTLSITRMWNKKEVQYDRYLHRQMVYPAKLGRDLFAGKKGIVAAGA